MTVASTTNRKPFSGDGVTTSFGTSPVVFYESTDLVVEVFSSAGVATTLTEGTQYTVSGGSPTGATGTVNLAGGTSPYGAPAVGTTLLIRRILPLRQDADFVNNDINDAEVSETALDKLTMIAQQQEEDIGRAIKVAASEGEQDPIVVTGKAGYYLRRNIAGTAFELAVGDANDSTFTQSGTGAVERSVTAKLGETVSVKDFGAIGDGVTDDTAAIQNALNSGGKRVFIPAGTYKISTTLTIPDNVSLEGEGSGATILDGSGTAFANLTDGKHITTAGGVWTRISDLSGNVSKNGRTLSFTTAPTVVAGDVLCIYNPTDYSWSGFRNYYRAGELVRVAGISGSTVTLQGTLCDSYVAGDVEVYRLDSAASHRLKGFALKGLSGSAGAVYGLSLNNSVDSSIEDVRVTGCSYAGIHVKNCFNVQLRGCSCEEDFSNDFGGDYGLIIGNSHIVNVTGGYFTSVRHGITIGGGSFVGAVSNRHVTVIGAVITCTGAVQAADIHGNAEYVTYADCVIDGGITPGGDFFKIDNCHIRGEYSGNGNVACQVSELRGCNLTITNNTIENANRASGRGAFIDIGGNTNVIDSGTKRGGTICISGNTMLWSCSGVASETPVKAVNRGYVLSEEINFIFDNNKIISSVEGARSLGPIVQVVTAGNPWGLVRSSGNTMVGCGILQVQNTVASAYAAKRVFIENNSSYFAQGPAVFAEDVSDYIAAKGNTVHEASSYGMWLSGYSGGNCRFIHATGNSFLDNLMLRTAATSTDCDMAMFYADYAVSHDNVGGSFNEYIVVSSNAGFTVGETITGGTSGETAVVKALRSTGEIMIGRTRSGAFSAAETITGGTSGASTSYTSTGYTQIRRNVYNTITNLWRGNNVGMQTTTDTVSSVSNDTAI